MNEHHQMKKIVLMAKVPRLARPPGAPKEEDLDLL